MRHLFTLLLLAAIAVTAGSGTSRADGKIRLAQAPVVTPVPLTPPTLPNQNFTACMITCNTQVGTCQGSCQALRSGVVSASSTVVGITSDPTQCALNCTAQQTICAQACSRNP
jgi:hypothetical protein